MISNWWYAKQDAGAKVTLDKIRDVMNRQSGGLNAQGIEVSKQINDVVSLIDEQRKMLAHNVYSQAAFDRLNDQINAAQSRADVRVSDYKSASDRFAATTLSYSVASAQYAQMIASHTQKRTLCAWIFDGGAAIALVMVLIGQARRWQSPIQPGGSLI